MIPEYVEVNTSDLLKEKTPFTLVGAQGGIVERVSLGRTPHKVKVYLRGRVSPITKIISRNNVPCRSTIIRE